jgi:hypothetical protein
MPVCWALGPLTTWRKAQLGQGRSSLLRKRPKLDGGASTTWETRYRLDSIGSQVNHVDLPRSYKITIESIYFGNMDQPICVKGNG